MPPSFEGAKQPPPKLEHWMYGCLRKACETYAVRIGRGIGHGSPILWQLKKDDAAAVVRKRKAAEYVRRKRKVLRAGRP